MKRMVIWCKKDANSHYLPTYLLTRILTYELTDSLTHAVSYIITYIQDLSLIFQHAYVLLHIITLYLYKYHIL